MPQRSSTALRGVAAATDPPTPTTFAPAQYERGDAIKIMTFTWNVGNREPNAMMHLLIFTRIELVHT